MFDLINGIPIHPLVVHAVVVLIPIAAIGAIAIALKPAWRRPYGPLVVAAAVLAAVLCPVATSSGEALEKHVGDPGEHADLGDQLIWFVLPLAIFTLALVLLDRRQRAASATSAPVAVPVGSASAAPAPLHGRARSTRSARASAPPPPPRPPSRWSRRSRSSPGWRRPSRPTGSGTPVPAPRGATRSPELGLLNGPTW